MFKIQRDSALIRLFWKILKRNELTEAEETIKEQVKESTKEVEKSEKRIEQLKNSQLEHEKKVHELKMKIKDAKE